MLSPDIERFHCQTCCAVLQHVCMHTVVYSKETLKATRVNNTRIVYTRILYTCIHVYCIHVYCIHVYCIQFSKPHAYNPQSRIYMVTMASPPRPGPRPRPHPLPNPHLHPLPHPLPAQETQLPYIIHEHNFFYSLNIICNLNFVLFV